MATIGLPVPSAITTEIAVVGAGIIGAAIAYQLAKEGRRVVLVDAAEPGLGSSGACDGYISVSTKTPGPAMLMAAASAKLYPGLARELGQAIEYRRVGGLMLIEEARDLSAMAAHAGVLKAVGVRSEIIDRKAMLALEPALSPTLVGALSCPDEAQVTPYLAVLALIAGALARGAATLWNARVVGCDVDGARIRRLELVRTDASRVHVVAEQYVLAAGIGSAGLGRLLGIELPVTARRGEILVTARGATLARRFLVSARYLTAKLDPWLARRSDDPLERLGYGFTLETTPTGQHLIGSTRVFAGEGRASHPEAVRTILAEAVRRVPALARAQIVRAFVGLRPFVPDKIPLLGRSRLLANLLVATGHEGDGVTLAPMTALMVAALVAGRAAPVPIEGMAPDRFTGEGAVAVAAPTPLAGPTPAPLPGPRAPDRGPPLSALLGSVLLGRPLRQRVLHRQRAVP